MKKNILFTKIKIKEKTKNIIIDAIIKDGDITYKGNPILEDRKSTRLNSSHIPLSRMPSSA